MNLKNKKHQETIKIRKKKKRNKRRIKKIK